MTEPNPVRVRHGKPTMSAASEMMASGMPLKIVSDIIGHASVSITGDIYGHGSPEVAREAAAELAAAPCE
jgi:integrase